MGIRRGLVRFIGFVTLGGGMSMGCSHGQAPMPTKELREVEGPLGVRKDFYFWLREKDNPKVLAHLKAENQFTAETLSSAQGERERIFQEQLGRLAPVDDSVPIKGRKFEYFQRTWSEKDYPAFYRRSLAKGGKNEEQLLLDANELGKGKANIFLVPPEPNPEEEWMAYGKDEVGRRFYTLVIQDVASGRIVGEVPRTTGDFVWGHEKGVLFYTEQDSETLRPYKAWQWNLKTNKKTLIFEERDTAFNLVLRKDHSERFVYLVSLATDSAEWRFLEKGSSEWKLFSPREPAHEYSIHDGDGFFLVHSNLNAPNFRLLRASYDSRDRSKWREIIPHREQVLLEEVSVFPRQWVLLEREKGLPRLRVMESAKEGKRDGQLPTLLTFPDKAYTLSLSGGGGRVQFEDGGFRYVYSSPKVPPTVYFFDFSQQVSRLLKQKAVPTYDAERYETERVWVKSGSVEVPVVLFWKKVQEGDSNLGPLSDRPILLQGYGAYGYSSEPYFDATQVSLADRGFVLATAQIRGGMELGRAWYEDGRLKNKQNTFSDFIAVTRALPKIGYGAKDKIFARGGSAGGLLMGAVLNQAPELYRGVVAEVPFVDVLTTMLDESLPLTAQEYTEWGDPRKREDYLTMAAYSPYDNVKPRSFPHVFVTAGWEDSQVPYWEAAKWVAKLRENQKGSAQILLKTELEAGHGGAAGRIEALKEEALVQSFLMWVLGVRLGSILDK
jgi:oligopeptidase B